MEQLWNRGVQTVASVSNRGRAENGLDLTLTLATGCHLLPFGFHGKEGVDGSSPSEGSAKVPQSGAFFLPSVCGASNLLGYGAGSGAFRHSTARFVASAGNALAEYRERRPPCRGICVPQRSAQLGGPSSDVRTRASSEPPTCHAGGRGFESRRSRLRIRSIPVFSSSLVVFAGTRTASWKRFLETLATGTS